MEDSPCSKQIAHSNVFAQTRFGMPAEALKTWILADSGMYTQPHPKIHVAPRHRVDYQDHAAIIGLMSGKGLSQQYSSVG